MLKNISTKFVNNLQRLIKKKKKFSQSNKLSFKQSILNEGKVITKFSRLFTTVSNYLLFQTIYNKRVEERSCCHVLERCHVERKGGASFTPEARSANISWRISGSHFCDFNYSLDPSSSRHQLRHFAFTKKAKTRVNLLSPDSDGEILSGEARVGPISKNYSIVKSAPSSPSC